ncbi:MAG: nitroreductase family deazaflavin-dependent oxidoreductase [Acidimicrobiales bacterium]
MSELKDTIAKVVNVFHRNLFEVSKGKIGGRVAGMPVVELTTTGRKSGQKRPPMLTTPIPDEARVVLIASYGGDDRHPSWYLNLRDNPDVEILMDGTTRPMKARVAADKEKAELWPEVIARYKGYGEYQTKTDRDIPVVILEPKGPDA